MTLARHPTQFDSLASNARQVANCRVVPAFRKLQEASPNRELIESVYGIGYKLEL